MTKPQKFLIALLTAIPPIWVAILMATHVTNGFHSDQWNDMLPVVAKSLDGTLAFEDLWKLHYEHRLFFPRLVMLQLAHWTHWDTRYECWLQFAFAGALLYNIHRIRLLAGGPLWLMPVASLFIFTPMDWENFMLGFQIHFWIPAVCFSAVIWMANIRKEKPA